MQHCGAGLCEFTIKELTTGANLARSLQTVLSTPTMTQRACDLKLLMENEHGAQDAAKIVTQFLEQDRPTSPAVSFSSAS